MTSVKKVEVLPDVAVAVVRLLAIAVDEIQRHHGTSTTEPPCLPDYRSWPMVQTAERNSDKTLRFYVCSKGLLASGDQCFPVGTQFVMETSDDRRMEILVMAKRARPSRSERPHEAKGVWTSVRYWSELGINSESRLHRVG